MSMLPQITTLLAAAATTIGIVAGASSSTQVMTRCVTIDHSLSYGSSGAEVVQLQKFLGVKMTAYFGYSTQRTLTEWQKTSGLIKSSQQAGAGALGPKTRAAMRCKTTANMIPMYVPPVSRPATTSTTSVITQVVPVAQPSVSSGGGGGGSVSVPPVPPAHQCAPFTQPRPPASQCTTGPWQVIEDEAGCPAEWSCIDPNAAE